MNIEIIKLYDGVEWSVPLNSVLNLIILFLNVLFSILWSLWVVLFTIEDLGTNGIL